MPNEQRRAIDFNVSGMHCQGCEQAISMLLKQHDAVESVQADAKTGKVQVTVHRDVNRSELADRIALAGYEVQ